MCSVEMRTTGWHPIALLSNRRTGNGGVNGRSTMESQPELALPLDYSQIFDLLLLNSSGRLFLNPTLSLNVMVSRKTKQLHREPDASSHGDPSGA